MSNHLDALLKALTVPSERIELESKKNVDLFFKNFKKKKRNILTKLNKNQINISQVILFHEKLIDLLSNKKKTRLENIINQTNIFFPSPSLITDDDVVVNANSANSKKRVIEENVDISAKKPKLMAVDEEIKEDHLRQSSVIVEDGDDVIGGVSTTMDGNSGYGMVNTTYRIEETAIETVGEAAVVMNNPSVTTDVPRSTVGSTKAKSGRIDIESSNAARHASVVANGSSTSHAGTLPRRQDKSSSMKTPQPTLYKSKYHQDYSRSQTLNKSVTKPPSQIHSATKQSTVVRKAPDSSQKQRNAAAVVMLTKISSQTRPTAQQRVALQKIVSTAALSASNGLNPSRLGLPKTTSTSTMSRQPITNPNAVNAKTFPQKTAVPSASKKILSTGKLTTAAPTVPQNAVLMARNQSTVTATYRPPVGAAAATVAASKPPSDASFMSTMTINNSDSSTLAPAVFKTPFSKKRQTMLTNSCLRIIETHDSYDISDLADVDSDEEDDDNTEEERENKARRRRVPDWCKKSCGTLSKLIQYQSKHCSVANTFRDPLTIPIDIRQIFGSHAVVKEGVLEEWTVT